MKKQNLPILTLQKNILKKICALLLFLGTHFMLFGQDWTNPLGGQNPNFYDVQKSFNTYWQDKDFKTTKGWKAYRRWEDFWLPRINPDGSFPTPNIAATEWANYRTSHPALVTRSPLKPEGLLTTTGAWTTMGPTTSNSGYSGIGRINCVAFHPTDPDIFWVGTPAGGLWQTTDGGLTWGTNSEDFPSLGVSAIAVNPVDPDVIYIGTGDGDGYDTYFYGMRRSTDGGASWTTMAVPLPNYSVARRIIINPNTPSTIIASTSNGIYRSTDDGANWTLTSSPMNMYDIAFKPGDPNTVYASSSSQVFVSVNGGATWTSTLTIANSRRIALAVTAADPSVVGVLSASSVNSGFNGYYSSANSGTSFTLKTSTPNLLGWEANGSDTGGQGGYDLCVAISPTNANTIYIGGVNLWKSTNGGTSWTINNHWWLSGSGYTTVHADKHYLAYQNSGTLFQCNDGGIYKTTNDGTNWTDLSNGLVISQMYRLGTAQTSAAVMTGLQDNSSKLMTPSVQWLDILGTGDGMEGAIDPTNDKIAYTESYYGSISRLALDANYQRTSVVDITPINPTTNLKESGAWVTPFVLDPNNPATMYIGYNDIYKSLDRGSTWTKLSTNLSPSPNKILQLAVAPSNSSYIYASNQASTLFKTTNGGSTWSSLSPPTTNITSIAVSPTDPNILFVTCSNYSAGQKVFKSVNGGTTWINISGTLPNVPANCIIYEKNTGEGLYVGTDLGVFYRNAALPDWIPFQDGLPNVIVRELDINYSTFKVLAATYGRGLWQSPLYYDGPAVCNTPSGLSATNVTALSATLSWTGSQLATTYTLQYRPVTTPAAAWTDLIVNSNNTIITGLTPATQYECQVRSNCDAEVSAFSAVTTFTTATGDCFKTPTAQGAYTNSYTGTSTMYWSSQTGISKYKIEWKKTSDVNWQVGYQTNINSNYFDVNWLTPATTYQWRVSSVCVNEIISAPSSIGIFTTPAPTCSGVASAPTLYLNGVWTNAAYLYWTQTYGKGYLFAYKKTSETSWTYLSFASYTSIILDNLLPNTAYECKIKSSCDGLNEVYSNVQTFTTKAENCADRFVPLAEYTVTNITNTTATLNWPAVPNATGYRLEINNTVLTVNATSYNIMGLTANTAYSFKVIPLCTTGSAYLYPYTFSFRTSGTGCQAPPTLSSLATTTATTAKIYCGPTGGATGYTMQYRISDPANYFNSTNPWTSFTTTNTNYTFTGLAPHTTYDYKITTATDGCYYIFNSFTTSDAPIGLRPFPVGLPTCLEDDFRELEKLYDATGGDSWTNKTNWFTSSNMATWNGISLTASGCDVQSIYLGTNNLVGTLPMLNFPELLYFRGWGNALSGAIPNFNMPKLNDLSFQDQNTKGGGLTGSIPNFAMPQLLTLALWGNKLSGSIPNFNMPLLERLWLSSNQLTGSIPNFNMPNMLNMDLGGNSLSGSVPNFNMPNMLRLAFGFNQLSGTIPNFNMPLLQELWGQNCQFTGNIPNFNMPNLRWFVLNNNQLTGNVPDLNMPLLSTMYLNNNQLSGSIPSLSNTGLTASPPTYRRLWLQNNKFIFGDMESKPWLTSTDVRYEPQAKIPTAFNGTILSVNTGSANNMQQFSWYKDNVLLVTNQSNTYTPTISGKYYCKITHNTLTTTSDTSRNLTLQSDDYTINICGSPATLSLYSITTTGASLSWATVVGSTAYVVEYKPATGTTWTTLPSTTNTSITLTSLTLATDYNVRVISNCNNIPFATANFTTLSNGVNPFPVGLPTCLEEEFRELEKLYIATNGNNWTNKTNWFTSPNMATWYGITLSASGCDISNIRINYNNLVGTLPLLNFPNLQELALYGNTLSGSIPNFNIPTLTALDLGPNQLSGSIPNFNLPNLTYLYLGENQLTGSIPNFNLPSLNTLSLSSNLLTGSIPNFNLPNLTYLQLQSNQFSGSIPNFNMPNLKYFYLSRNQLTGSIPNFNMPLLSEFLTNDNQLTGSIPNFNSTNLAYLNLSNNKFIFSDMEGKSWLNVINLGYAPQAKIPIAFNGTSLSVNTGSANNVQQFTWYKNNVIVATNQSNTYKPTSIGTYYCKISHNTLTTTSNTSRNLILQSEDYIHAVIPVELLNFTATPLSKTTQLNWQTASEKNASHFDVEQSSNGKTFEKIGEVKANGNSATLKTYSFIDETPFNGLNYYRLRQVDEDGTATLSNIVSITFNTHQKLTIFPNPTKDKLTIISESIEDYSIMDVLGREILRGVISGNQTDVDVSNLPAGMYLVKTKTESVKFSKY